MQSLTDQMFSFLTVEILVTAIIIPILVKFLYDPSRKYAGYQKRNIMQHSKASGELRILACIYRPDNIPVIIKFLQASCPKRGSLVTVYVLHLIDLRGRAAPLFISHKMQKKTVSNRSYSENVILSFKLFEEKNWGTACVYPFTAISPPKLMHEDVCMLALDKLASIVVLPFHRKWFIDGSIESDDNTKRALNCSVLERAPCSVGILIDRGRIGRFISSELSLGSSFRVAMIFLGGSDDREALTLAKRMSQNTSINLTVFRFIVKSDEMISTNWEKVLDSEVLKEVKPENNFNQRVKYVVEMVNEGQETLAKIQSVVPKYDLVIVGRRDNTETPQTSGLDRCREFPELGIVGNCLITEDLPGRYSVLVVQQQQTTV